MLNKPVFFIKRVENGFFVEDMSTGKVHIYETDDVACLHKVIDENFKVMTEEEKAEADKAMREEILKSMPDKSPESMAKVDDIMKTNANVANAANTANTDESQ